MTRRDLFITLNEPFGNPGFLGVETRAERARPDEQLLVEDGFESCTYASAVSRIDRLKRLRR